jgi:hypothetical protein
VTTTSHRKEARLYPRYRKHADPPASLAAVTTQSEVADACLTTISCISVAENRRAVSMRVALNVAEYWGRPFERSSRLSRRSEAHETEYSRSANEYDDGLITRGRYFDRRDRQLSQLQAVKPSSLVSA